MKKVDELFSVKVTKESRKPKTFTVCDYFGDPVCKTTSWNRDYVALLLWKYEDGSIKVINRFGRWDLVGKGDSKFAMEDDRSILVKVDDQV